MDDTVQNFVRQQNTFDPDNFRGRVDIVGAGATGSHVLYCLAKMGVQNLHVWDFDKVESHNLPNQYCFPKQIGSLKTNALKENILQLTHTEITVHHKEIISREPFGNVVFLLTDTMSSRKDIFETSLKFNPSVECVIETRLGEQEGRIYTFNPCKPDHIEKWEETLYPDEETSDSLCGTQTTVLTTVCCIASIAVNQFIRWSRRSNSWPENEVFVSLNPLSIYSKF